jgi:mannose/fructose/N-acetylgalactosamine-specific phosphotransferase system component IID
MRRIIDALIFVICAVIILIIRWEMEFLGFRAGVVIIIRREVEFLGFRAGVVIIIRWKLELLFILFIALH